MLLDLEKEVLAYASARGLSFILNVSPKQLHGLEINPYAQQLAQVAIWIGYLQWMHHNGFKIPDDPVWRPSRASNAETQSSTCPIRRSRKSRSGRRRNSSSGIRHSWVETVFAKVSVTTTVQRLFEVYKERVPGFADICCYWFEKARAMIELALCSRAGLLATQGIRGGANRKVLQQIKATGSIFFAESDRDWILDGAAVHVSMVGFDSGEETTCVLDGQPVAHIHANLSSAADTTTARRIAANLNLSFMGDTKGGAFDILEADALEMLHAPESARPPQLGRGGSLDQRSGCYPPATEHMDHRLWRGQHAGTGRPITHARFQYVDRHVRPERATNKRDSYREKWWCHVEPRPAMREAFSRVKRFLATTSNSRDDRL